MLLGLGCESRRRTPQLEKYRIRGYGSRFGLRCGDTVSDYTFIYYFFLIQLQKLGHQYFNVIFMAQISVEEYQHSRKQ